MVKAKVPQLHDKYLRVVVIEAYAEDSFGATVCHELDNIELLDNADKPLLKRSIAEIMKVVGQLNIGDIFLHCHAHLHTMALPDYLIATDYGNGVIHLQPTAFNQSFTEFPQSHE